MKYVVYTHPVTYLITGDAIERLQVWFCKRGDEPSYLINMSTAILYTDSFRAANTFTRDYDRFLRALYKYCLQKTATVGPYTWSY